MVKTVVELTKEEYDEIRNTGKQILKALEDIKAIAPPEYLSRKEFMASAKIGPNKMNDMLRSGKLKFHRKGPKIISIPYTELTRYQRGEIL